MNPSVEYEKNIITMNTVKEMIACFRQQNYNRAERMFPDWSRNFSQTIEVLFTNKAYFNKSDVIVEEQSIMATMKGILQAQEQNDYILLADLLELQLLPFLYSIQDVIRQNEETMVREDYLEINLTALYENKDVKWVDLLRTTPRDAEHYIIEDTGQGCPTLRCMIGDQGRYLHSNNDPVEEGMLLAREYYHEKQESYIVYGLGLAYHIEALSKLCDGTARVDVFESDLQVIHAAFTCRNLTTSMQRGIYIHYDPDLTEMKQALQKQSINSFTAGLMIHAPSICGIHNAELQKSMRELFVQESSIRNQSPDMYRNFRSNARTCKLYVDILEKEIKGKTVFLIAAGPSLDKNIALLKQKPENAVIMAVGTAYRKLMQQQMIRPDYVVFLDAAARMYVQATGFENETIPYLMASTACRRIASDYHGPKYLICQEGYTEAEQYAKERDYQIYQSGGSVATIAMDVALQLGAARIVCLGLDLAYTGDKMHATYAGKYDMIKTDGLLQVRDWDGNMVQTSVALDMYRKWIEQRVTRANKELPDVELINATEGGAYIQGMKHMKLSDLLNSTSL